MTETVVVSVAVKDQKNFARRKEVQHLLGSVEKQSIACLGVAAVFKLQGKFLPSEIETIVRELLCDPVVEVYAVNDLPVEHGIYYADVWPKPGVADPVGGSVLKAIRDLKISTVLEASSGTRYVFSTMNDLQNGTGARAIEQFASRALLNPLIQECKVSQL